MAANGGLEFQRYAGIVAQQLQARGYAPADRSAEGHMVVQLGYGVDRGQTRIVQDPFYRSRYGYGGFGYDPFYSPSIRASASAAAGAIRWAGTIRSGMAAAGSTAMSNITARSTSTSVRRAPMQPLFDGRAQARSETNRLDVVVPSLVEAMFTGFPGRSGETVKITIPTRQAAPKAVRAGREGQKGPAGAIRRAFLFRPRRQPKIPPP